MIHSPVLHHEAFTPLHSSALLTQAWCMVLGPVQHATLTRQPPLCLKCRLPVAMTGKASHSHHTFTQTRSAHCGMCAAPDPDGLVQSAHRRDAQTGSRPSLPATPLSQLQRHLHTNLAQVAPQFWFATASCSQLAATNNAAANNKAQPMVSSPLLLTPEPYQPSSALPGGLCWADPARPAAPAG